MGVSLGEDDTPTQLVPKMGEFQVSNSVFYEQLIVTDTDANSDGGTPLTGPIDPFAKDDSFANSPASGVLLTFEQSWTQKGLALGELRKSLCLAPGEITKLAVTDWRRETTSEETSERVQAEAVRAEMGDVSKAVEIQEAVANETKTGLSTAAGGSRQTEKSASAGFLLWGASTSTSTNRHWGMAATVSTGHRDVSSAAAKNVERRTEQVAQSTRTARATQIREVTEAEGQSTTTRIVANYNHAHALTMQYYEVLQIYSLRTTVVRADRCVFIPMKPFDFSKDGLTAADDAVIELLRRVLRDLGAVDIDEMVGDFHEKGRALDKAIGVLELEHSQLTTQWAEFSERVDVEVASRRNAGEPHMTRARLFQVGYSFQAAFGRVVDRMAVVTAQLEAKRAAMSEKERLFGLLDQNRLLLSQQMWMRIDDYTWHRLLAGKTYSETSNQGQELGGLVSPKPIGYFGNYVAFRWDFPKGSADEAAAFEKDFVRRRTTTEIVVPADGLFAEAVIGQSNSAEKIDITRFWNWQDSPIPILPPAMAPVATQSRARDVAMAPQLDFGPAVAALREAGVRPDDISNEAILGALQKSLADDSAALIAAAATAGITASGHASEGAGRAGQQVVDSRKNIQDFVVGLANSEVAKMATSAVTGGATGGLSSVGALLNVAADVSEVADPAADTPPNEQEQDQT